jgi:hypothetical protein
VVPRAIAGDGFCGGLTTWSTASFETVRLAEEGMAATALVNALGGLAISVAAAALGINVYEFYGLGRGGVLGDVDVATVRDAFYFFHPRTIDLLWRAARDKADPVEVARAHVAAAYAYADRTFGAVPLDLLESTARGARTVLAADTVSLLAAVLLYLIAVGDVRGFAFFLGLSTLLDIGITWYFTRPLVILLGRRSTDESSALSMAAGLAMGASNE